jgi:hypothetical protein
MPPTSIPAVRASESSDSPSASAPTIATRRVFTPRRASVAAMLKPTPPGPERTPPGLEAPSTGVASVRAMRSTTMPPKTVTRSKARALVIASSSIAGRLY